MASGCPLQCLRLPSGSCGRGVVICRRTKILTLRVTARLSPDASARFADLAAAADDDDDESGEPRRFR